MRMGQDDNITKGEITRMRCIYSNLCFFARRAQDRMLVTLHTKLIFFLYVSYYVHTYIHVLRISWNQATGIKLCVCTFDVKTR